VLERRSGPPLLLRLETRGARTRKWPTRRPRPHLDKPSPRIVERGSGRSGIFLFLFFFFGPELEAGGFAGAGPPRTDPTGGRGAAVMNACEGAVGVAMEISSTKRSFLTSEEGNGFCRLRMAPIYPNFSFRPRRTERTSVRSGTGSPRSPSESAIDLSLRQ
jgi:hypothetical protein